MNANHLTICKFKNKDDPNFDLVASVLRSMANKITDSSSSAPQSGGPNVSPSAPQYESTIAPLRLEYSDRPIGRVLGQVGPGGEQLLDADAEESGRRGQYQ